jgi:hypothetical protein
MYVRGREVKRFSIIENLISHDFDAQIRLSSMQYRVDIAANYKYALGGVGKVTLWLL